MTPAIFVINLDRAPLRLASITAQVNALGWTFERVVAIDASGLDARALSSLAPDPWSRYQARAMTPGEICCLASHRLTWTRLVASGRRWGLVLEDDAILGAAVPDALRVFQGQDVFGLLKLEGITTKRRKNKGVLVLPGPPDAYLMETVSAGAAAYCLSADAARRLLRVTRPMNREADFFIRQYGRTGLVVGEFRPFPASQDRSGSYIGTARGLPARPRIQARVVRTVVRLRESIARRLRFRALSRGRPVGPVTMAGSSSDVVGQDL